MEINPLRTINIFEDLSEEQLKKMFKLAHTKLFPVNTIILEEGKLGGALYFIAKGRVHVTKKVEGKEAKIITSLGAQSIFGEMSLFDNLPYSANVIALEETRCMVISKDRFDEMLQQDLPMAFKLLTRIITILSQRLRNTNEEIVAMTTWKDRVELRLEKSE
ncbi:cyclic nucleotide-binding domain-containing protein [bacterium]|nr:cyclic nucleotide-binding domain-containing protein [bacterium]